MKMGTQNGNKQKPLSNKLSFPLNIQILQLD